ncbi:MAG: RNA pseudouridine synthase [Azospirillum brasilense]|nr:MAG: RNA pseudouridine synthase [Azospirillum brasilense]
MNPLLPTAEQIEARILYRDACMLVIDKPAGIAVHVTAHDKVALDQCFHHLQFGLPRPPALAHRLDRGTSGCLVLGRHRKALDRLGKMFKNQRIEKTYLAVAIGRPAEEVGVISAPILKTGEGSKWKLQLDPAGQEAVTHYRVLASASGLSLLELSPKTGRTHQLRLHCAFALGTPIVGDPFYGPQEGEYSAASMPMLLHAQKITIPYYANKPPIECAAPMPSQMQHFIEEKHLSPTY